MNPWLLLGILVWLYILSVLKKVHLPAYFFIVGSIGLFFILISKQSVLGLVFHTRRD